jgi:hypothetical protein
VSRSIQIAAPLANPAAPISQRARVDSSVWGIPERASRRVARPDKSAARTINATRVWIAKAASASWSAAPRTRCAARTMRAARTWSALVIRRRASRAVRRPRSAAPATRATRPCSVLAGPASHKSQLPGARQTPIVPAASAIPQPISASSLPAFAAGPGRHPRSAATAPSTGLASVIATTRRRTA